MKFPEPHTEAERRALAILRDAELHNDDDYKKLAELISDAVKDLVDKDEPIRID